MSARPSAREAIVDAFRDIILESGYENVRVLDVVKRSGIARSTFYEHFQSREDVLRESLRGVFQHLAQFAAPSCDVARVALALDHVADNRVLVSSLIGNPGTEVLVDVLSEVIELESHAGAMAARAAAGAQLAVLFAWLDGREARDATDLAKALRRMTVALLQAA